MTVGIKRGGYAGVCRAQQWDAFLYRASRAAARCCLGGIAEPGVIGDVDHPCGPVSFIDHLIGKDRFIADQGTDRRQTGQMQGARTRSFRKASTRDDLDAQGKPVRLISPNGTRCDLS